MISKPETTEAIELPPSLAVTPNIPWEKQTLEQLAAERDYWIESLKRAAGWASAKAADDFRGGCEGWIQRRMHEQEVASRG